MASTQVASRQQLQRYFDVHAARLRGDGVNRFAGKFFASRRVYHGIQPVYSEATLSALAGLDKL